MGNLFSSKARSDQMASAKQIVESAIHGNKVVVFSKTYCPYCTKAKRALQSTGLKPAQVTVIELDQRSDGAAIQDYLAELTGGRSVPRVFIDEAFIGGGDDTDALARSGKLEVMLRDKGILQG